jgi:hypothetical protein
MPAKAELHWGTMEVRDEEDNLVAAHVMPCDEDGSICNWHTTSPLCGCNPQMKRNKFDCPVWTHFENGESFPDDDDS